MSHDPNCIFCKIVAGKLPCTKLYEDATTLAFMDINPLNPGHALAIPKSHAKDVFAIEEEAIAATVKTARKVARAARAALSPAGVNLLQSSGPAAGQSVFHLHFHIIPRHTGDALRFNWTPVPGDMAEIGRVAALIRAKIEA